MTGPRSSVNYRRQYEGRRAQVEHVFPTEAIVARRAQLIVCGHAIDVEDARRLLDMLGILPDAEGVMDVMVGVEVAGALQEEELNA